MHPSPSFPVERLTGKLGGAAVPPMGWGWF